ncbi:MAG: hypothetical protein ACTSU2_10960 [Promethearchaeota archaeon]
MPPRVDIYIISKKSGNLLFKCSILNLKEEEKDQLISGFLVALNEFAKNINFPQGVSLIRSGDLEARYVTGEHTISVLIIDYEMPLGLATEPILSSLAEEINKSFENLFKDKLIEAEKKRIYSSEEYSSFNETLYALIDKYGRETLELYQKLILIEAMYVKVPQKWCLPLIERVSNGENILKEVPEIIRKYPNMLKAIEKVNYLNRPVWEIFAISIIHPEDFRKKKK